MATDTIGPRQRVVELDAYVLDTLMPDLVGHDRQPSAFLVYLFLWRAARGDRGERGDGGERGEAGTLSRTVSLSLREIADGTGLSRRAVQDGVGRLHRRRLIGIRRAGITAVPEYTVNRPWWKGAG